MEVLVIVLLPKTGGVDTCGVIKTPLARVLLDGEAVRFSLLTTVKG